MDLSWLVPEKKGIPVLMYHQVWPGIANDLCIEPNILEQQWSWLQTNGYRALGLREFLDIINKKIHTIPEKCFLLTFDDGYLNNYTYVYPLLQKFNFKATFFVIADTLENQSQVDLGTPNEKMKLEHYQQLDPKVVQLALHGYEHEHFDQLTPIEIKAVMERSIATFEKNNLPFYRALAYPYGSRPKNLKVKLAMKKVFHELNIEAAFRIGNQVCKLPPNDIFEIKRIDIRGTDSLSDFQKKLKKGKLKPF